MKSWGKGVVKKPESFVKSFSGQQKGMGKAWKEEEIEKISIVEVGRCQKIRASVLLADSL